MTGKTTLRISLTNGNIIDNIEVYTSRIHASGCIVDTPVKQLQSPAEAYMYAQEIADDFMPNSKHKNTVVHTVNGNTAILNKEKIDCVEVIVS